MAITISLLALIATIYQLYLQRNHNEKSLRPLGQIDFLDRKDQFQIYVRNNGMGPMIIPKIIFVKKGIQYTNIEDCLTLDPKSYRHMLVDESVKKILLPGSHFPVFEKNFKEDDMGIEMEDVRNQLSLLTLTVDYRDIYDNKFAVQRSFEWFSRHFK